MFPGFDERFTKDLQALLPNSIHVKVVSVANRQNAVWLGGSTIASLDTFPDSCLSKEEFLSGGVSCVHQKFQAI